MFVINPTGVIHWGRLLASIGYKWELLCYQTVFSPPNWPSESIYDLLLTCNIPTAFHRNRPWWLPRTCALLSDCFTGCPGNCGFSGVVLTTRAVLMVKVLDGSRGRGHHVGLELLCGSLIVNPSLTAELLLGDLAASGGGWHCSPSSWCPWNVSPIVGRS